MQPGKASSGYSLESADARDKLALARFQVRESTKAIMLDLKQPIRMTERLCSPGESHGLV
jgi:hypothetical protein